MAEELNKIYVGGLDLTVTEDELKEAFSDFGDITDVSIVMDRETGGQRDFAFITFSENDSASAAAEAMDGKEHKGKTLKVNLAKPRS